MAEDLGRSPVPVPPKDQWKAVGWGPGGTTYEHEMRARERKRTVAMALKDIADAQGDVDGFIAQYDPKTRKVPQIAAEIAQRLLAAGRAGEALGFLERAELGDGLRDPPRAWQDIRLRRWRRWGAATRRRRSDGTASSARSPTSTCGPISSGFPTSTTSRPKSERWRTPWRYPSLLHALQFFLDWPALDRAAELLVARHDEIDGDHYEYLAPAAEALSERHPLAATLVLRAMIDFTLTRARSKRYRLCRASTWSTCAGLARDIPDFGTFETHDAYRRPAEGGARPEVRLLVADHGLMEVLPRPSPSAPRGSIVEARGRKRLRNPDRSCAVSDAAGDVATVGNCATTRDSE